MVKPRCHLTHPFPSISSVHIVLFCLYRSLVQKKIPVEIYCWPSLGHFA